MPKVVERDPIAEQRAAEAVSTAKTNAETALRNRNRRGSQLSTSAKGYGPAANSALAQALPQPSGAPALMAVPSATGT